MEAAISSSEIVQPTRSTADRVVRSLLRVGDAVDKNAILGARNKTRPAIVVSGIRCLITYIFVPIVAPFVGLIAVIEAPLSITLSVVAIAMGVAGTRRFWMADHRSRWTYTAFIGVVAAFLIVGIALDLASIIR
jgi:hypothetical protein